MVDLLQPFESEKTWFLAFPNNFREHLLLPTMSESKFRTTSCHCEEWAPAISLFLFLFLLNLILDFSPHTRRPDNHTSRISMLTVAEDSKKKKSFLVILTLLVYTCKEDSWFDFVDWYGFYRLQKNLWDHELHTLRPSWRAPGLQ